ncbi:BRO family protein [Nitrospira sp. MA-1]|nr:BRO family protein [Nitrospira sp. MA-1]
MSKKPEESSVYEKPIKLEMSTEEAIQRFAKVTKEEIGQQGGTKAVVTEGETQLVMFRGKEIRQVLHDDEWFFSIVDVIGALTGSDRPSQYWSDLKRKLVENEGFSELYDEIVQLPMLASDGKMRQTDGANAETVFRVVQSIPSPKAQPFKKWLAKVGYERIQEIQDPEIAIKRAMLTYKAKGYSDEWVRSRLQTITSRKELTSEWKKRGVEEGLEFAILSNTISKGTFDLQVEQHKAKKGLKKSHNLRDHMSPLELALTMLGETTTAEMAKTQNAQGFYENKNAAIAGGDVAGSARRNIEKKMGKPVVTKENFLPGPKPEQIKLPD